MKLFSMKAFLFLSFIFTFTVFVYAQTNSSNSNQSSKKVKPLKLLKKPRAPMQGQCSQNSGTVTLLITFDKSAQVTEASVISSSGCKFFDDNAVKVSKKIKFEPQTEDDTPVTVKKQIQYNFTVY